MAELSPLRRRMIEDMTIRNLSPATQRSYVHAVAKFSRYCGRSPDRLDLEDVRAFQEAASAVQPELDAPPATCLIRNHDAAFQQ
ncbi:phage integrase N-terminal SAM-like domain-containing protein, partial [Mesorhizobium sp. M0152]|uniref:phage integrase N-terminal SAM-like domain-containing protein n=1 Tax=Mesorhizobium sp. M0152 TaxID=2956898 RepID=UPI00333DE26E